MSLHRPDITLTGASAADAESLAALRIDAMRESLMRIGRFDLSRARDRFLCGFSPRHTRHIEVEGERVGFVVVKPVEQGWLLDHLYVHPRRQGQGIGAEVLARILAEADAHGISVRVGALRGSESNRFYLRHGFVQVDETEFDNHYVRPANAALGPSG